MGRICLIVTTLLCSRNAIADSTQLCRSLAKVGEILVERATTAGLEKGRDSDEYLSLFGDADTIRDIFARSNCNEALRVDDAKTAKCRSLSDRLEKVGDELLFARDITGLNETYDRLEKEFVNNCR